MIDDEIRRAERDGDFDRADRLKARVDPDHGWRSSFVNRGNVDRMPSMLYHRGLRNADGSPLRARVNGMVKTWKTRPNEFKVPMKYGFKECFYLTNDNCNEWSTSEEHAVWKEDCLNHHRGGDDRCAYCGRTMP